jgi:hypothetical protein
VQNGRNLRGSESAGPSHVGPQRNAKAHCVREFQQRDQMDFNTLRRSTQQHPSPEDPRVLGRTSHSQLPCVCSPSRLFWCLRVPSLCSVQGDPAYQQPFVAILRTWRTVAAVSGSTCFSCTIRGLSPLLLFLSSMLSQACFLLVLRVAEGCRAAMGGTSLW